MTNEEIIEGNALISEFITGKPVDRKGFQQVWLKPYDKGLARWIDFSDLQYHKDWNWLMEVVEKICKVDILSENISNEYKARVIDFSKLSIASPINNIWQAVVKFIYWKNKTNSGNA